MIFGNFEFRFSNSLFWFARYLLFFRSFQVFCSSLKTRTLHKSLIRHLSKERWKKNSWFYEWHYYTRFLSSFKDSTVQRASSPLLKKAVEWYFCDRKMLASSWNFLWTESTIHVKESWTKNDCISFMKGQMTHQISKQYR